MRGIGNSFHTYRLIMQKTSITNNRTNDRRSFEDKYIDTFKRNVIAKDIVNNKNVAEEKYYL